MWARRCLRQKSLAASQRHSATRLYANNPVQQAYFQDQNASFTILQKVESVLTVTGLAELLATFSMRWKCQIIKFILCLTIGRAMLDLKCMKNEWFKKMPLLPLHLFGSHFQIAESTCFCKIRIIWSWSFC